MSPSLTESEVKEVALSWLGDLGYQVLHGPESAAGKPAAERSDPNHRDVVLECQLRQALERLSPELPPEALEDAYHKLTRTDEPSLVERNRALRRMLVDGVAVEYRRKDGSIADAQARVIDFDSANEVVRGDLGLDHRLDDPRQRPGAATRAREAHASMAKTGEGDGDRARASGDPVGRLGRLSPGRALARRRRFSPCSHERPGGRAGCRSRDAAASLLMDREPPSRTRAPSTRNSSVTNPVGQRRGLIRSGSAAGARS